MASAAAPRVFVHHIDRYLGKTIGKLFSDTVVGSAAGEDEDEEGEVQVKYSVVGTLSSPNAKQPVWADEAVSYQTTDELTSLLLSCDVAVFDMTADTKQSEEAAWAATLLNSEMENYRNPKVFVGVSSVATWAKTKPADPSEPDLPLTEDEYRRRRAHPNFKEELAAEKQIIKSGKKTDGKLSTYVIAGGLLYGSGESAFHPLFEAAWTLRHTPMFCIGNGQNSLPSIHVADLANCVLYTVETKPETRYIVAVDDANPTLEEVTQAVASVLCGSSELKIITREDALLLPELSQRALDLLIMDIKVEPACVREFGFEWHCQGGLAENIAMVVLEYKEARKLTPIKICLHGPPASGKTTLAELLAAHYTLPHVYPEGVANEAVARLEASVARLASGAELSPEDMEAAEGDRKMLDSLKQAAAENGGKYEQEQIAEWLKAKLNSSACRNQGYVLDGVPETEEQAKELFAPGDDAEVEEGQPDPATIADFVFSLTASDEFLKERAMNMPEAEAVATNNTPEEFTSRLQQFRTINTDEGTVLNYFDLLEVHPTDLDVSISDMDALLHTIKNAVGTPRNYGLPAQQQAVVDERNAKLMATKEAEQMSAKAAIEAERAQTDAAKQKAWQNKREEIKQQEQEVLDAAAVPLRSYLMKHVMPTLSEALVQVCKSRPDDPVDYLAEFLFKNNPQID